MFLLRKYPSTGGQDERLRSAGNICFRRNLQPGIRASSLPAFQRHCGYVPDSPIREQRDQVQEGVAKWRGNGVLDALDFSAQVGAHDDSVLLQLMKLLNQDLLACAREQSAELAQANRAVQHSDENRDPPFAAN